MEPKDISEKELEEYYIKNFGKDAVDDLKAKIGDNWYEQMIEMSTEIKKALDGPPGVYVFNTEVNKVQTPEEFEKFIKETKLH